MCVSVWLSAHTYTHTLIVVQMHQGSVRRLCLCKPLVFLTHLPACVLFVSTALLCLLWISVLGWCAEGWRDKATIQMERRFLWWCSVGEQKRAASWRETGIIEDHKHNTTQINPWRAERATTWAGYIKNFCFETKIKLLLCFLQISKFVANFFPPPQTKLDVFVPSWLTTAGQGIRDVTETTASKCSFKSNSQ